MDVAEELLDSAARRAAHRRAHGRAVLDDAHRGRRRDARRRARPDRVRLAQRRQHHAARRRRRLACRACRRRRCPAAASASRRCSARATRIAVETEVAERVLGYRTIGLPAGALVLVEDITEARRREAEIKVKEATIREVHHRVKNNLQTIASLLRIQARRSESRRGAPRARRGDRARRVDGGRARPARRLATRSASTSPQAARTVVDLVARGLVGEGSGIEVVGRGLDRRGRRAHRHVARARRRRARPQRARARDRRARVAAASTSRCAASPASSCSRCATTASGCRRTSTPDSSANLGLDDRAHRRRGRPARDARRSPAGAGTTVTVRVPARRYRERPAEPTKRLTHVRVLIAEDEALIRMDLREMLDGGGPRGRRRGARRRRGDRARAQPAPRRRVHGHQHARR